MDAEFWSGIPDAALWEPVDYRPSSWTAHVPFAFWLIDALRPRSVVELGTWYGMSYLAMCQAIAALGLDCQAVAIDTWQGDHQAGPIGDRALEELRRSHDPKYTRFSRLQRSTFDEALPLFAAGSIDLLHIDGLHTYEAVSHDFATWLPKLSRRAVVLFHDTQETHDDFGVYKFWAEVSARYPHFEFMHEHGLGVLRVGPDAPVTLAPLFDAAGSPVIMKRIQTLYRRLGLALRLKPDMDEAEQHQLALRQRIDAVSTLPEVRAALKLRRMIGAAA